VLQQIQRGGFAPPRSVSRRAPKPLEAVCLKAMAPKPEDRYPSPRALADDVEHWLADQPVAACRQPWTTRLARRTRRHRLLVTGAGAVLLAVAVVATGAAVLVNQARVGERRAKDKAVEALAAESRARAEAQANFARARKTVDDYLTAVGENVR